MHMLHTLQAWLIARAASVKDERGASMVEYGLLVALIAVIVAVGAGILGNAIDALFQGVAGQL
jgi:pilus assembly protein Flp/PilA